MSNPAPPEEVEAPEQPIEQPPTAPWSIDFGSFKCCVGVAEERQARIVLDDEFSRAEVPSFVSYQNQPARRFVGEAAAGRVTAHFKNTFVELPTLFLEGEEAQYPKCRHQMEGDQFLVEYDGEKKQTAGQIAAALFAKLKEQAAAGQALALGQCTLAVSGHFGPAQKRSVLDAAAIAGVDVARLVTSDVAAVYSYCDRHPDAQGTVLIVDVGHSFCAASISVHNEGKAQILASATVPVGASCVDHALYQHVVAKCAQDHGMEVSLASKVGQRILKQCQSTKKILSTIPQGVVHVELDDRDLSFSVTRAEMAGLCADKLNPLTESLEGLFASLEAHQTVDAVEIIGGGSCIPMFQERLQECLKKNAAVVKDSTLRKTLDLATACACGAALASLPESPVQEKDAWDADLESSTPLSGEALESCLAMERQIQTSEAASMLYEATRNKFEAMIYEMRGLSEGRYKEVLPSDKLNPIMDQEEEWLWGDGEGCSLEQLQTRQADVNAQLRGEFGSYYELLDKEAQEETARQEAQKKEFEAHQAAERAELEASGVVRDTRQLPFEERMKLVLKNKEEGTELFKGGNWEPAAVRYTKALNHTELIKDPSDEEKQEKDKVRLSLYLNLAMAFSKMKKWNKAIDNCRYALEVDPKNSKALFRRATAYYEEKDYDQAQVDLETASCIEPVDPAVTKMLKIVQKAIAKREKKEKATYGKMFG